MASPQPTTGTATPMELDPEQAAQSLKVSLADLSAKATALYGHKKFDEAAEVYAQAAEMQAEMNGELSPDNAEILFLYGRALFKVGQSKSDVLGGKAPETKKPKPAKKAKPANGSNTAPKNGESSEGAAAAPSAEASTTETKVEEALAEAAAETAEKDVPSVDKKPMFHFEGDENFEDSEEEDGEAEEGEEEEEDDDLAVAFEILDLARLLFTKKLEVIAEGETDKGKAVSEGDNPTVRHVKERLADTHDLLAEISLENERYPNAITDSRASLRYKKELYPEESEIIAEAHFKLSLALEFASVTKPSDEDGDNPNSITDGTATSSKDKEKDDADANPAGVVDQALRDEAAVELEAAIASTRLKLQSKEVELATTHNPEDNAATREVIAEAKEVIADMEQRLVDLRKPPIDINSALGLPPAGSSALPAPAADDEVAKNANDLSGLVRKKRKAEDRLSLGDGVEGLEKKKVKEGDDAN